VGWTNGRKSVVIDAPDFTVNAEGTEITFPEPDDIGPLLKEDYGPGPDYTLDTRVWVGKNQSPLNPPADRVTFGT
jgi:hypothetical protein